MGGSFPFSVGGWGWTHFFFSDPQCPFLSPLLLTTPAPRSWSESSHSEAGGTDRELWPERSSAANFWHNLARGRAWIFFQAVRHTLSSTFCPQHLCYWVAIFSQGSASAEGSLPPYPVPGGAASRVAWTTLTQAPCWQRSKSTQTGWRLPTVYRKKFPSRTFLVVQWLRISLPIEETRVPSLVRENPTCRGATKPASREPVVRNKKPPHWESCVPQRRVAPARLWRN